MTNRHRIFAPALAVALAVVALGVHPAGAQLPLNSLTLTKYMDPLPVPGPMPQKSTNYYEIGMYEVTQQLHSQLPPTTVWGYGTSQATASYPAATIEAQCGVPIRVKWTNNLPTTHLLDYAIDPTLHMAEWEEGVPAVVHVHGSEVESQSDGGPDAWFTQGFAEKGPGRQHEIYNYANDQLPATIWYHDHVLGITRLNVYAGLAGFYLLRDPGIEAPLNLPSGAYEIPLVIQDRIFYDNGQLLYPVGGDNPDIHPLWQPEFFGDVILANGKVWPYLNVEPRKYRFRMLNGSNARFYALQLFNDPTDMPGHARRAVPLPGPGQAVSGGYTAMLHRGIGRGVLHVDITSLYPSIMLADDLRPASDSLGVFSSMLRDLRAFRVAAKRLAQDAADDGDRRLLGAVQQTFKILINFFYGYLGFSLGHWMTSRPRTGSPPRDAGSSRPSFSASGSSALSSSRWTPTASTSSPRQGARREAPGRKPCCKISPRCCPRGFTSSWPAAMRPCSATRSRTPCSSTPPAACA